MGRGWGAVGLLLELQGRSLEQPWRRLAWEGGRLLQWLDVQQPMTSAEDRAPRFTTGYFVIASKPR